MEEGNNMRQEISEGPKEIPIVCVAIVLGLLSFMATLYVRGFQGEYLMFTFVAGVICGLCALPLGLKLSCMRLN